MDKYLDEHYDATGSAHHDYEPMHRAALVDTHLRNPKRKDFKEKWMNDMITTISEVFDVLNRGKEYEHLLKVALDFSKEDPEVQVKNHLFFSNTRFPNYSAGVFKSFLVDLPLLVRCLEENQIDENNRNKMKYAKLSNKILNVRFLASLSGATDEYDVFSELVQKLQTVCLLHNERFDQAMLIVSKFSQMLDTVDIVNCCCDDNNNNDCSACLWPNFHMDIKSLEPSFRKVKNWYDCSRGIKH